MAAGIFTGSACTEPKESMVLVIEDPRNSYVYYTIETKQDSIFSLCYTHSVSASPVEGTFITEPGGTIKPLSTTYTSFGPGLPMDAYEIYTIENGLITIYHENEEPRESIRLWVSPLTDETLYFEGKIYPLGSLSESHLLIEIYLVLK